MAPTTRPRLITYRRGHRIETVEELLECPRVSLGGDLRETGADRRGVGHRAAGRSLQRLRQVLVGVDRAERQQHLSGRHGVRTKTFTRPVADLHLVVGVDLVEIQHVEPVGDRQPGSLAGRLHQYVEMRTDGGDQRTSRQDGGGDLDHAGADAIAAARLDLFDHAEVFQCRQHPRHGALRKADPVGDVGDPGRPAGQAPQHREGALDRLHARHSAPLRQPGNAPCIRAASSVFCKRQAIVIGPVPPGIGVIAPAICETGS